MEKDMEHEMETEGMSGIYGYPLCFGGGVRFRV